MITQTISRWLNKLFAWWPWKGVSTGDYPQAVNNLNKGMAQDQGWRTKEGGPVPQPGIASVAVEQELDDASSETSRFNLDERVERTSQSPPSKVNEHLITSHAPSADNGPEKSPPLRSKPMPVPTHEQQLAFLQYLVRRGIVNEGFKGDQVPEQYQHKD